MVCLAGLPNNAWLTLFPIYIVVYIYSRTMLPRRGYEPVDSVEENVTRGEVTNEGGNGRRSG